MYYDGYHLISYKNFPIARSSSFFGTSWKTNPPKAHLLSLIYSEKGNC